VLDADPVGKPATERDLGDLQVARAEPAKAHVAFVQEGDGLRSGQAAQAILRTVHPNWHGRHGNCNESVTFRPQDTAAGGNSALRLHFRRVSTTEYEAVPAVAPEARPRAGTVVMKLGGTAVGDPQKLKDVATRIVAAHSEVTRV